jgi:tRNA (guanine-N7-)-methyltransferase
MTPTDQFRRIRSFVRREGRMTPSQKRALQELWPRFGIDATDALLNLDELFGRQAPRYLEIGFGMGTSLAQMAARHPERDYLGIEVHRPGVGGLLIQLARDDINNVRVMSDDAVDVLRQNIPDNSLDGVYLFFPDPWPKKKHHKRRIVQAGFVELVADKLKVNGVFHMATDWQDYAEHMLDVVSASSRFENTAGQGEYAPRPEYRPLTKFEQRGQRLGHDVWDLVFSRC